jgi:hypothetical protein
VTTPEFIARFDEFIGASGWRASRSPAQLVTQWADFVGACEAGYSSTIYEYENERSVRDLLDRALHDPILRKFPQLDELHREVERIDERFRRVCREDVTFRDADTPWWRRCVPRRAEGEFAEDLESMYGIHPEQ